MGSFGTTVLLAAILLAVPSAGFTLPLAQRVTTSVGVSRNEATSTEDLTTSTFDPSDAFAVAAAEESPFSELEQQSSSVDIDIIIRDLDGRALTKEYFAEKMGVDSNKVESYTCPEEDKFRGFMSNACRVILLPGRETAFYKSIVFEHLDHAREKLKTAPHKLIRDAKSYQVVASFLLSKACQEIIEKTGVGIPKIYDAKSEPNYDNPMESKFSFLFEDFAPADGWYQQWLLVNAEECKAALSTFAKIHAFFWSGSTFWKDKEAAAELEAGVWESGSYVQPKAQNWGQCKIVAKEWATKKLRFEKELSKFDYWENLGERLESVAVECGRLAHPFGAEEEALAEQYSKFRTFTHGDPKQANLLFRSTPGSSEESKELQVGLIDFQWSGFGLAASDIAHFLTSAVHADCLVDGGEEMLQRYYFDEVQKYLVEFGAYKTAEDAAKKYSYDTFIDQYETAVLDICRLMIAYTWDRFEFPVEKDDEAGKAKTMNKTSYNKSIPNIIWLMSRCDAIMKSRGV